MQKTMQKHCAVFRDTETLAEGLDQMKMVNERMQDIDVTDRSLIWNTDLVETLELDNLMAAGDGYDHQRGQSPGKPRCT